MTLEEAIIHEEEVVGRCEVTDGDRACAEAHRQLADCLRELAERRKADSCKGCAFEDLECVYCLTCKRSCKDKYKPERRTE